MDIRNLSPFGRKNIALKREEENPFLFMQHEMSRLFDSLSRSRSVMFPDADGFFTPRMDVTEDAKAITVSAELPGIHERDIDLSISGDVLTIRGEKKEEKEDKDRNYYYSERSYGSFIRSIPLPGQIEKDKISANFKKGVLTITMPKSAAAMETAKKIEVRSQ